VRALDDRRRRLHDCRLEHAAALVPMQLQGVRDTSAILVSLHKQQAHDGREHVVADPGQQLQHGPRTHSRRGAATWAGGHS